MTLLNTLLSSETIENKVIQDLNFKSSGYHITSLISLCSIFNNNLVISTNLFHKILLFIYSNDSLILFIEYSLSIYDIPNPFIWGKIYHIQ